MGKENKTVRSKRGKGKSKLSNTNSVKRGKGRPTKGRTSVAYIRLTPKDKSLLAGLMKEFKISESDVFEELLAVGYFAVRAVFKRRETLER